MIIHCGRYPSLRVAYIEELEEPSKDKSQKTNLKSYYSVLARAALPTKSIDSIEPAQSLDQVKILTIVEDRLTIQQIQGQLLNRT